MDEGERKRAQSELYKRKRPGYRVGGWFYFLEVYMVIRWLY